jgi:hypothetical protein
MGYLVDTVHQTLSSGKDNFKLHATGSRTFKSVSLSPSLTPPLARLVGKPSLQPEQDTVMEQRIPQINQQCLSS